MLKNRTSIALLCLSLLPSAGWALGVMVNEFRNGSNAVGPGTKMTRDEYIEFVITENTSAAELAALTFGDSADTTATLQSVFRFDQATLEAVLAGSSVSAFQAGTIIVVKGLNLGAQNLSYNPMSNNLGDTDAWSIELVAGQGARDHPETLINGNLSVGNNGEVIWISNDYPPTSNTDTSGFIHAIGYDNAPGVIGNYVSSTFGSENMLGTTVTSGNIISNTGGSTESLVASATGTMGAANGVANEAWIVGGLRTASAAGLAPEPGRLALLALGGTLFALRRRRSRKGGCYA